MAASDVKKSASGILPGATKGQTNDTLPRRLRAKADHGDLPGLKKVLVEVEKLVGPRPLTEEDDAAITDLLSQGDQDGWTAMHYAARSKGGQDGKNHLDCLKLLIRYGASTNVQDNHGWSPLHVAAQFGEPDGIIGLLEANANSELLDKNNMTPRDCGYGIERKRLLERPEDALARIMHVLRERLAEKRPEIKRDESVNPNQGLNQGLSLKDHKEEILKEIFEELQLQLSRVELKLSSFDEDPTSDRWSPQGLFLQGHEADSFRTKTGIDTCRDTLRLVKCRIAEDSLLEVLVQVRHHIIDAQVQTGSANQIYTSKNLQYLQSLALLENALEKAAPMTDDSGISSDGVGVDAQMLRDTRKLHQMIAALSCGDIEFRNLDKTEDEVLYLISLVFADAHSEDHRVQRFMRVCEVAPICQKVGCCVQ